MAVTPTSSLKRPQEKTSLLVNRYLDIDRILMRLDSVLLQKVREGCNISPLIPEEESGSFGEVIMLGGAGSSYPCKLSCRVHTHSVNRACGELGGAGGQQAGSGLSSQT